jgi:hypothetical protein
MSGFSPGTASFAPSHQDDSNDLHLPQVMRSEGQSAEVARDKEYDWEHDPANPRNWSPAKKWTATTLVALYTFVTPLASSIMAPGLPDVAVKFDITNPTVIALTLSIFLLTFSIGPLFAAPLSEVYGRVWVLHLGNLCFLAFNLGCALSRNTVSFIVFRLLSGLAGSAPMACGGGVVSDLFAERDRASAMALYSIGPLIGEFYVCCATSTRVHATCKALLSVPSWEVSSQNQSVYSMSSMSLSRLLALPQ